MAKLDRKKVSVKKVQIERTAADLVPDERGAPVLYDWNEDDIKKIKNMARIGLKVSQIASIMNCNIATMDRRIASDRKKWEDGNLNENNIYAILEKSRAEGDGSIARTCYEVALEQKHPTMLIWLSKVRLGWRETIDVNAETKHVIVYETQLADGVLRQEQKQLDGESGVTIIDAMIDEVTEEVCQKPESE